MSPVSDEEKRRGEEEYQRLAWLVSNRNQIQTLCFEILSLLKANATKIARDEQLRRVFGWALGIAFSLWRAVFITHAEQDWGANLETGAKYIEKVIKTNAINFNDDDNMRLWAFGYYSGNAHFRIQGVQNEIEEIATALIDAGLTKYKRQQPPQLNDARITWDEHCRALEIIVGWLHTQLPREA